MATEIWADNLHLGHRVYRPGDLTVECTVQGLDKRGLDVAFLFGGNSVLAAGGVGTNSTGSITLWDTARPVRSGPIGRLDHHRAGVTSLQVVCSRASRLG